MSELYIEHRNTRSEKKDPSWYKRMARYALSFVDTNRTSSVNDRRDVLDGIISDDYYKKVLNPYNSTDKKYTRHRAEMRNYDIMKDIIRRYIGEFSKQPFDFEVKCNDPEVITRFNDAFAQELSKIAVQQFINELNNSGVETNMDSKEVPDFQEFFTKFKQEYMDDVAAQGQDLLEAIIDWTESNLLYYTCFYNFIVLGQVVTYRDIRNNQIFKESVDPADYFPVTNGKSFIEDHNMGIRKLQVTIPELLENYSDVITDDVYNRIDTLFKNYRNERGGISVPLALFKSRLDEKEYSTFTRDYGKYIAGERYEMTKDNTIDGYHIVFTTQVKVAHISYIDPVTNTPKEDVIETDSYSLDANKGHVSLTWEWLNEVWEMYMFGREADDIITVPRPIGYQRRDANNLNKVKLPYNGMYEVIPNTGFTFSIPDAVLPFQLARNIFFFYRERIIAKNKDKIMIVPKSLLGDTNEQEDKIYRLENSSIFPYDDSEDESGTKAQHIRVLDASLSQFIGHLTDLCDKLRQDAWDTVDMNTQRYGDIDTSAGKGITEEAIVRSSMGSVIIFTMFEKFLEKEYLGDLEYSKVAYVNGKKGAYTGNDGNTKFLDLDVDKHILANYGLHVVSSVTQAEKKRKLENLALAAAQNGEFKLGVETILKDSVSAISRAFREYDEANRQYQASIANEKERLQAQAAQTLANNDEANRQSNKEIAQMKEDGALQRTIITTRAQLAISESTDSASPDGGSDDIKNDIAMQKLALDRQQQDLDMRKHNDIMAQKEKDRASKEKIANSKKNNSK